MHNTPFGPISASGSKCNPQNIDYIPPVPFFAFLDREQKQMSCKVLFTLVLGANNYLHKICPVYCCLNTWIVYAAKVLNRPLVQLAPPKAPTCLFFIYIGVNPLDAPNLSDRQLIRNFI